MRIYILLLALLSLAGCSLKPVETVYYEQEDVTRFTTKPFITGKGGKEIELVAVKECSGKVICADQDIKLTIKHTDRFSFFKGKDLVLETEKGIINLNELRLGCLCLLNKIFYLIFSLTTQTRV